MLKKCERVNKPKRKFSFFLLPSYFLPYTNHILHTILISFYIILYYLLHSLGLYPPSPSFILYYPPILFTMLCITLPFILYTLTTRSILLIMLYNLSYPLYFSFLHSSYTYTHDFLYPTPLQPSKSTLHIYVLQDSKFFSYYLTIIHT